MQYAIAKKELQILCNSQLNDKVLQSTTTTKYRAFHLLIKRIKIKN